MLGIVAGRGKRRKVRERSVKFKHCKKWIASPVESLPATSNERLNGSSGTVLVPAHFKVRRGAVMQSQPTDVSPPPIPGTHMFFVSLWPMHTLHGRNLTIPPFSTLELFGQNSSGYMFWTDTEEILDSPLKLFTNSTGTNEVALVQNQTESWHRFCLSGKWPLLGRFVTFPCLLHL